MKTISIICNNDSVEFYHGNEEEAKEWCYQMNEQGRDDALKQHGDASHYRFYWHVHEAKPLSMALNGKMTCTALQLTKKP